MKKISLLAACLFLCGWLGAQIPSTFSYQEVVRDATQKVVASKTVGVKISILLGSASGTVLYSETHQAPTNANGLLTIAVGGGTVASGVFAAIDWSKAPFFIKSELDLAGGSTYTLSSTQELLSVPFAAQAKRALTVAVADSAVKANTAVNAVNAVNAVSAKTSLRSDTATFALNGSQPGQAVGDLQYWDGSQWVVLPAGQDGQMLSIRDGQPSWLALDVKPALMDTIFFEANGGQGTMTFQLVRRYESTMIKPCSFTKANSLFDVWTTKPSSLDGKRLERENLYTSKGNIRLYAQWNGAELDQDGNTFRTVQIGAQTWMAENLKVTHYRDGSPIPNITDNAAWMATTEGAYCYYDFDDSDKDIYGALYNYYAVENTKNLCPAGWRISLEEDYQTLIDYLGGSEPAGGKLKTTGTIESETGLWEDPNFGATNIFRFNAAPAGCFSGSGHSFYDKHETFNIWFGKPALQTKLLLTQITNKYTHMRLYEYGENSDGRSVRCIKGAAPTNASVPDKEGGYPLEK